MIRRSAVLAVLAVLVGAPGAPAVTETESQTVFEHSWVVLNTGTQAAQTFRIAPGNAGTISRVGVYLSAVADGSPAKDGVLRVGLWSVSGGLPASSHTFEEFDIETVPQGLFLVDFSAPVIVAADDELAVVLEITGGAYYWTKVVWAGSDTDTYTNGEALSRTATELWTSYTPDHDIDRYFRIYNE